MKTEKSGLLNYYTEYRDSEGHDHYAIHRYRASDGWVWSMRDYKFPGLQYPESKKEKKMNDMINPNVTIDAKPSYDGNMPMRQPTKYWCVYDKAKRLIAKFRDEADANEYKLKGLGEYSVKLEDVK